MASECPGLPAALERTWPTCQALSGQAGPRSRVQNSPPGLLAKATKGSNSRQKTRAPTLGLDNPELLCFKQLDSCGPKAGAGLRVARWGTRGLFGPRRHLGRRAKGARGREGRGGRFWGEGTGVTKRAVVGLKWEDRQPRVGWGQETLTGERDMDCWGFLTAPNPFGCVKNRGLGERSRGVAG